MQEWTRAPSNETAAAKKGAFSPFCVHAKLYQVDTIVVSRFNQLMKVHTICEENFALPSKNRLKNPSDENDKKFSEYDGGLKIDPAIS